MNNKEKLVVGLNKAIERLEQRIETEIQNVEYELKYYKENGHWQSTKRLQGYSEKIDEYQNEIDSKKETIYYLDVLLEEE